MTKTEMKTEAAIFLSIIFLSSFFVTQKLASKRRRPRARGLVRIAGLSDRKIVDRKIKRRIKVRRLYYIERE